MEENRTDGRRRLSDADVAGIRRKYAQEGISLRALARRYGVDKNTIARLVSDHRREWERAYHAYRRVARSGAKPREGRREH